MVINYNDNFEPRAYKKPCSELLETAPEGLLCVSGDGEIAPVEYEEWGAF
jgi:hypothetical protein